MSQRRNTAFVSVSLTLEARDALRRLSWEVSAAVAQKVSLSDTILAIEQLAFMHDRSIGPAAQHALTLEPPAIA